MTDERKDESSEGSVVQRALIVTGIVMFVIVSVLAVGTWVLQRVVDADFVEQHLAETVHEETDGLYTAELEGFSFSVWRSFAELDGLSIRPVEDPPEAALQDEPMLAEISQPHARLSGISLWQFLVHQNISISHVELDSTDVRLTYTGADPEQEMREEEADDQDIRIGTVELTNGTVEVVHAETGDEHYVEQVAAEIHGVNTAEADRFLFSDDIRFAAEDIHGTAEQQRYSYETASVDFSSGDSTMVMRGMRLEREDDDTAEPGPLFFSGEELDIRGADFHRMMEDEQVVMRELTLLGPDIQAVMPDDPEQAEDEELPLVRIDDIMIDDGAYALYQQTGDEHLGGSVDIDVAGLDTADEGPERVFYTDDISVAAGSAEGTTEGGLTRYVASDISGSTQEGYFQGSNLTFEPAVDYASYMQQTGADAMAISGGEALVTGVDVPRFMDEEVLVAEDARFAGFDATLVVHGEPGEEVDILPVRVERVSLTDSRASVYEGQHVAHAEDIDVDLIAVDTRGGEDPNRFMYTDAVSAHVGWLHGQAAGRYNFEAGPLEIDSRQGSLVLTRMQAEPSEADSLHAAEHQEPAVDVRTGSLSVSQLDYPALQEGELVFNRAVLDGLEASALMPDRVFSDRDEVIRDEDDEPLGDVERIAMLDEPGEDGEDEDAGAEFDTEQFREMLPTIMGGSVVVRDGFMEITDPGGDSLRIDEGTFTATGIDTENTAERALFSESIQAGAELITGTQREGLYRYELQEVEMATDDSTFAISDIYRSPTVPDTVVTEHADVRTDPSTIHQGSASASGVDYFSLQDQQRLDVRYVEADSIKIEAFIDHSLPPDPDYQYPHEAAIEMDLEFAIDSVHVSNSRMEQHELADGGARPGTTAFGNVQAQMENVSNDSTRMSGETPMTMVFEAEYVDDGPMRYDMRYNLVDPEFDMTFEGGIGRTDMREMNAALPELVGVEIQTGVIDTLKWAFQTTDPDTLEGEVHFYYLNLEIEIVDQEDFDRGVWEELLTFLAEELVILDENLRDEGIDGQSVTYEIPDDDTFFEILYNSIVDGVISHLTWVQ